MKKFRALMVVCAMCTCMFALTACDSSAGEENAEEETEMQDEAEENIEEEHEEAETSDKSEETEDISAE